MFRIINYITREVVSGNYGNYWVALEEAANMSKNGPHLTVEYIGE